MVCAYIGLGANLGDPPAQLREALRRLTRHGGLRVLAQSSIYRSAPLGPPDQPDYCNAVAEIETNMSAVELLDALLAIERAMGRRRDGQRWQARLIDLDLLLYGDACINAEGLKVPHPEMHKRNFVLAPLAQIAPDLLLPGHGRVSELAEKLEPIAIVARHE